MSARAAAAPLAPRARLTADQAPASPDASADIDASKEAFKIRNGGMGMTVVNRLDRDVVVVWRGVEGHCAEKRMGTVQPHSRFRTRTAAGHVFSIYTSAGGSEGKGPAALAPVAAPAEAPATIVLLQDVTAEEGVQFVVAMRPQHGEPTYDSDDSGAEDNVPSDVPEVLAEAVSAQ